MILNEKQKEMYKDCIFLNERFSKEDNFTIDDFDKDKILKKVESEIDKLKKKNSNIKGVTLKQLDDKDFLKRHNVKEKSIKVIYQLVNWIKAVRRETWNIKLNHKDFSEVYLCKKMREYGMFTLNSRVNEWMYAVLLLYIEPLKDGKSQIKVRIIKLNESYLKK